MLTLQIIGIMDSQWKADGLDLRCAQLTLIVTFPKYQYLPTAG